MIRPMHWYTVYYMYCTPESSVSTVYSTYCHHLYLLLAAALLMLLSFPAMRLSSNDWCMHASLQLGSWFDIVNRLEFAMERISGVVVEQEVCREIVERSTCSSRRDWRCVILWVF